MFFLQFLHYRIFRFFSQRWKKFSNGFWKYFCSDDHDDNDDPSLGEDSGGGDGDGTDFHQLFINFNLHIIL